METIDIDEESSSDIKVQEENKEKSTEITNEITIQNDISAPMDLEASNGSQNIQSDLKEANPLSNIEKEIFGKIKISNGDINDDLIKTQNS